MAKSGGKRDENEAASATVRAATGLTAPSGVLDALLGRQTAKSKKNPAAVALGRLGGLKGGKARAEALTADERSRIAKKAAASRWTARREAEVLERVRQGKTVAEIAKDLHISAASVKTAQKRLKEALRSATAAVSH